MDLANVNGTDIWLSSSHSSSAFPIDDHGSNAVATHGYFGDDSVTLQHENGSFHSPAAVAANATAAAAAACAFEQPPLTDVRFWIVTVFGTTVSLISIVENSFFFYLFSTRKHHRTTYNMYMMFLTFFDFFVSGAYVLLMSTNVLSDYLQSPTLVRIWFHYMVPILTVSHCGITSSCFLILAATFERYCLTLNSRWVRWVQRNRKYIILSAILLGIISKGTICIEFNISYVEECAGTMTEFQLQFAEFVYGTPYHTVWRFWYRNIVTVFFPFFALLALNIRIVRALTFAERQSLSNINSKQFKRKKVARSATRTTVLVVFTYLISNVINVVLTTWEHIDNTLLITDFVQVYAIALDLASLLTNLASALRPPIYLVGQPTLRQEVFALIKQTCRCGAAKPLLAYNTQTVTDIIYTKVDDNSKQSPNTEHVNLSSVMPNCAALVASAINTSNPPDLSVMDLMKDEEDFLEEEHHRTDEDHAADLVDLNNGGLELMAARMRQRRQLAVANSRLASVIVPSCVNAAPCLTRTAQMVANGCLQNGGTSRCRSEDIAPMDAPDRKRSALSDCYNVRVSTSGGDISTKECALLVLESRTTTPSPSSLPTTPVSSSVDVRTRYFGASTTVTASSDMPLSGQIGQRLAPPTTSSTNCINTTMNNGSTLGTRLSSSLASVSSNYAPLVTTVMTTRRGSSASTVVLSNNDNNNENIGCYPKDAAYNVAENNGKLLNNHWLQSNNDKETLL